MFSIKRVICLLLMFFLSIGVADAKTVRFAILSDIHYTTEQKDIEHSARNWGRTQKLLDSAIDGINISDIDFVVFLGDNIDRSEENLLISFMKKIRRINKPYYMCLGNHDAYKISGISKEDYVKIVNKYGKSRKYNTFNYTFPITQEIIGVVVDASFPVAPNSHGVITKKTMAWIDKTLEENSDKKVLIFQHFPIKEPYDKKTHNIVNKTAYEEMLAKHSNILAVFSGHYHREKIIKTKDGVYHVSVSSLGETNKYQFVKITYDARKNKVSDFDMDIFSVDFLEETDPEQEEPQEEDRNTENDSNEPASESSETVEK